MPRKSKKIEIAEVKKRGPRAAPKFDREIEDTLEVVFNLMKSNFEKKMTIVLKSFAKEVISQYKSRMK